MTWRPQPRPRWVDALNALGENLGDAGRSMVPLDESSLLQAAQANTGLDDFGNDWFRQGLAVLLDALESEARLTLVGRLLARAEIQRILQNRLAVENAIRAQPEIREERVAAPIVVTGLGRSGTTLLHELLSLDPANRVPMQWELMYSVPPPETATYENDRRIDMVRREICVMDEADPAFPMMHDLAADLPTECIYIFAHQFATDMFVGEFHIPSYAVWSGTTDLQPAYDYHRRFLQLLQWHHRADRWALKAPSHLGRLESLLATYPDARVVITHRDPLRVIGSLSSLMATLHRMRSDHVDYDALVAQMAFGFEYLIGKVMQQRDDGIAGNIVDIRYADLVRDPVTTVCSLYRSWDLPFDESFEQRIGSRLASRKHGESGGHRYSFADTGLDLEEQRAKFRPYMERYDVPEEV